MNNYFCYNPYYETNKFKISAPQSITFINHKPYSVVVSLITTKTDDYWSYPKTVEAGGMVDFHFSGDEYIKYIKFTSPTQTCETSLYGYTSSVISTNQIELIGKCY